MNVPLRDCRPDCVRRFGRAPVLRSAPTPTPSFPLRTGTVRTRRSSRAPVSSRRDAVADRSKAPVWPVRASFEGPETDRRPEPIGTATHGVGPPTGLAVPVDADETGVRKWRRGAVAVVADRSNAPTQIGYRYIHEALIRTVVVNYRRSLTRLADRR